MRLVEGAGGLIEGFRPGVTERLGLGPEECRARNPRLAPWAHDRLGTKMARWLEAGRHDVNYIFVSWRAAYAVGRPGETKPDPPLNLVGDFGGGGMLLAYGVVMESFRGHEVQYGSRDRRGDG